MNTYLRNNYEFLLDKIIKNKEKNEKSIVKRHKIMYTFNCPELVRFDA